MIHTTNTNTGRRTAIDAIKNRTTDTIPVGIELGGSWPFYQANTNLHQMIGISKDAAQIYYDIHDKTGADIIISGDGATALMLRALGCKVIFREQGVPDIVPERVKSEEDLDALDIEAVFNDTDVQWLFDMTKELEDINGQQKLLLTSGRAPFTLAGQLCGLSRFSRYLYKDKALAHRILAFTTELSTRYFKKMLDLGIDGWFIADPNASGDVISPKHFKEFALPYLKQVTDALDEYQSVSMIHICGDIQDRLDMITETGIDCVSIDTKVPITKALKILNRRMSLAGNVDPVNTLEFEDPLTIQTEVFDTLKVIPPTDGFILLPGCDIANSVPFKNVKAFVDAGHSFNRKRLYESCSYK